MSIELCKTPLYDDSSLIALWRMEGNSMADVLNVTGTDANVAYSDNYGKFGQGALFNGSSSRIAVANNTKFDVQRLTISAWVYSSNFNQNGFIFEKGSVNTQYSLFFESNYLSFRTVYSGWGSDWSLISTSSYNSQNGIVNNAWNHIVATYDGVNKIIYVNGKIVCAKPFTQVISSNSGGEFIGAYGGTSPSYWFNGRIDDLAVFSRALTYEEVKNLYNGTITGYTNNDLSKYRRDRFVGYENKILRLENTPLFNDNSLWGYWKLDGSSKDAKGANNGIDTNVIYPEENEYFSKSAKFNGSNSRIQVSNLVHRTANFTYSWWTKWNRIAHYGSYFENGSWGNTLLIRQENFNTINIYSMSALVGSFSFSPIKEKWYHLAIVRSGNTLYLYVDGILNGSMAFTVDVQPSTNMWFGASQHAPEQCITAKMADIAIFTRALTANEIYSLRHGFQETNNLSHYKRLEDNSIKTDIGVGELQSPLDIPGCKTWIDISSITNLSDGNAISSVNDLSGSGNHLTQISAGQNPIYKTNVLNQLPIMRGTVASSSTFYIPFAYSSPTTIFYIARQTGGGGRLLSGRSNNWLAGYHGGYKNRAYYNGWLDEAVNRQATDNKWYVWAAVCNSRSYLYSNGSVVKQATTGVTSPSGLTIGYLGNAEFSDFDIGEIIGYNRELSPREIAIVTNYLLKKWGLDYNVAFEKPAFLSFSNETHWYPTDGSCWTGHYIGTDGLSNVTVDLLNIYQINRIDVFHYWSDSRAYYFNKVETSVDGVTWTTRFDSEVSGRYTETYEGKSISFTTSPVRYIRNTLNGSSANVGSHWVEIRAMGH